MLTQNNTSEIDLIIERIEFWRSIGLWPSGSTFNYRSWLDNFTRTEKKHAYKLLDKFIYVNEELCVHFLEAALTKIGGEIIDYNNELNDIGAEWRNFISTLQFCAVRGEIPNDTDSGLSYLRLARKRLKIPESNIKNTQQLLLDLYNECQHSIVDKNVVFVDDFIGTGNQFLATWFTPVKVNAEVEINFHKLTQLENCQVKFYCCTVAGVEEGIKNILSTTNKVKIKTAHIINTQYNLLSDDCQLFSTQERTKIVAMLRNLATRTEMKEDMSSHDWRGYEGLGLSIGLRDMIPDASLAVYRWNYDGWVPLLD